MPRYALIDDATGECLGVAADPSDLFDAAESAENDEIAQAIARALDGEAYVPIGGGAGRLLFIADWSE